MTESKKSIRPVAITLWFVLVELALVLVMAGAAPLLFVFLLALIIPATAYLALRGKWYFALVTPFGLAIILILNYSVIYLLCLPLLALGFCACIIAAKSGKLFFSAALIIFAVVISLSVPVYAVTAAMKKSAGDLASEYVLEQKDDAAILTLARLHIYESAVAGAREQDADASLAELQQYASDLLNSMSQEEILTEYAAYVQEYVDSELLFFIFSVGILLAMTMFFVLTLLVTNYQYLLKDADNTPSYLTTTAYNMTAPRYFIMPRRYALYVLSPFIALYIAQLIYPSLAAIYNAAYFGLVLVPFGFAGIGVSYFMLHHFRVNTGLSTLIIAPLAAFVFVIFSIIGIVDYFLNIRFLLEYYKKNKRSKKI